MPTSCSDTKGAESGEIGKGALLRRTSAELPLCEKVAGLDGGSPQSPRFRLLLLVSPDSIVCCHGATEGPGLVLKPLLKSELDWLA